MTWTRPSSRYGMSRYRCDWRPTGDYAGPAYCVEEFRTASDTSVHIDQLQRAGWTAKKGDPIHLCPKHPIAVRSIMPERRRT